MTSVFLHFLNLSITAGWMVLVVLLLRLCLKKAPRWITCVLWGLVALRLVVPFTIESSVSLIPATKVVVSTNDTDLSTPVINSGMTAIDKPLNDWLQTPVKPPVQSPLPPVSDTDSIPDLPPGDTTPTPQKPDTDVQSAPQVQSPSAVSRAERILQIAAPVWLVGIGLMLLYELFSILRVRSRVWDAVRLQDNVWQSDRVASPFIFGLFRPRIYIPYGLEEPVLEQVLSHERAHLHRRDHWIKPFAFTLLAVYWYNPLLWVGYILLCRDIEVACDERVIRGLDDDCRRRYATALLECGVERRSIAACPLAFGEVSIKQRIKSVLNYRKPLLWVIIVSLVICVVAAVCLLTVPEGEDTPKEEPLVVISTQVVMPDQHRQFYGTDTDGRITESGPDWLWAHAENPDDRKGETDIPLVLTDSKVEFDELITALDDPNQYGMENWFDLDKYDEAFFEEKAAVWLFVPGYDLNAYSCTVTLENTNKGMRYAVTLDYTSTSIFNPWPATCQYLMLFEVERDVVEQADSLSTRHERAPLKVPEKKTKYCDTVGEADLDGDGAKDTIRLYYDDLEWDNALMVVTKADGTPILCEVVIHNDYSQCYLLPQEDGSSLLLLVEAGDIEWDYSEEHFGVLSLKDGVRTVLDNKYEVLHPVSFAGLEFYSLIPYVQSLSKWMENVQLLYECERTYGPRIHYGDALSETPYYTPLSFLDRYKESADDTLQAILENILDSLNAETVSVGEMDFDGDGTNEQLSVIRYIDSQGIYQRSSLVVREADGSILTGFDLHYDYADGPLSVGSYVYRFRTESGTILKRVRQITTSSTYDIYDLSVNGTEFVDGMSMTEWLDYVEAHDGELLFYFQGLEMYFPNQEETPEDNYLNIDATKYTVVGYNESIRAYNAFLKGQRAAYEFGDLETKLYVSDLYATVNDNGIKRYALADVTGDGMPELITEGYTMSVFSYQSGRVLRLYESGAGCERVLLSNGYLWEERLGGGNTYRYTKFFAIGTTRTVELGDPGYDTDGKLYHVDRVWMNKADFDAKTATYFENAKKPALLIWYDYTTKQPTSQAMVQYLSLLDDRYQNNANTYYALRDVDEDGISELLVKVGDDVIVGSTKSDITLSSVDWVSFQEQPLYMVDVTFDGFLDAAICIGESAQGKTFIILRWDTKKERLVEMKQSLINPSVDTQASVIRTSQNGDGITSYSIWKFDEEHPYDFVRTHSLYFEENPQATGDDDRMKLVVTENGETKTLYVRGEPYWLNPQDPRVSPYYDFNFIWQLDSQVWINYIPNGEFVSPELQLQLLYDEAVQLHMEDPAWYRDIGEWQSETNDIVQLRGQLYQSYVAGNVDIRYIFVSNKEYEMTAKWDWVPIGTREEYSLDNLGMIDDGQKGELLPQWKTAYLDFLSAKKDSHQSYALVFVDSDMVPELYLSGTAEAIGDSICTYKNGVVVEQQLSRTGGGWYIEKNGKIINQNGNMGQYYTHVYRLEEGTFTLTFRALESECMEHLENDEYRRYYEYSIGDAPVSEADYKAAVEAAFDFKYAMRLDQNAVDYYTMRQQIIDFY